jgi:hypothetical protein
MQDIMTFLARHLTRNDESSKTLQKMVQKGELIEVEGVAKNGVIYKKQ